MADSPSLGEDRLPYKNSGDRSCAEPLVDLKMCGGQSGQGGGLSAIHMIERQVLAEVLLELEGEGQTVRLGGWTVRPTACRQRFRSSFWDFFP